MGSCVSGFKHDTEAAPKQQETPAPSQQSSTSAFARVARAPLFERPSRIEAPRHHFSTWPSNNAVHVPVYYIPEASTVSFIPIDGSGDGGILRRQLTIINKETILHNGEPLIPAYFLKLQCGGDSLVEYLMASENQRGHKANSTHKAAPLSPYGAGATETDGTSSNWIILPCDVSSPICPPPCDTEVDHPSTNHALEVHSRAHCISDLEKPVKENIVSLPVDIVHEVSPVQEEGGTICEPIKESGADASTPTYNTPSPRSHCHLSLELVALWNGSPPQPSVKASLEETKVDPKKCQHQSKEDDDDSLSKFAGSYGSLPVTLNRSHSVEYSKPIQSLVPHKRSASESRFRREGDIVGNNMPQLFPDSLDSVLNCARRSAGLPRRTKIQDEKRLSEEHVPHPPLHTPTFGLASPRSPLVSPISSNRSGYRQDLSDEEPEEILGVHLNESAVKKTVYAPGEPFYTPSSSASFDRDTTTGEHTASFRVRKICERSYQYSNFCLSCGTNSHVFETKDEDEKCKVSVCR